MPIYEYKCRDCGDVSEFLLPVKHDGSALTCRICGSRDLEKCISAPSAISISPTREPGHTCCGLTERCETPPCSSGEGCRKD